jgi:hypothetical protein
MGHFAVDPPRRSQTQNTDPPRSVTIDVADRGITPVPHLAAPASPPVVATSIVLLLTFRRGADRPLTP